MSSEPKTDPFCAKSVSSFADLTEKLSRGLDWGLRAVAHHQALARCPTPSSVGTSGRAFSSFNFGIAHPSTCFRFAPLRSFVRLSPYSPVWIHRPTLGAASRRPLDELTPQVKNAEASARILRVMVRKEGATARDYVFESTREI